MTDYAADVEGYETLADRLDLESPSPVGFPSWGVTFERR